MKQRDEARQIMAEYLGRELLPEELVHHKDGNHYNHTVDNLKIVSRAEHVRIHKPVLGYKFTEEQRKKLSESHRGQTPWNKGRARPTTTNQARENLSRALRGRKITWGDKISKAKTKITKGMLLEFVRNNPAITIQDVINYFSLQSRTPIQKHGGLRKLKKEVIL